MTAETSTLIAVAAAPTVVGLVGIILNRVDIRGLRSEMTGSIGSLRSEMGRRFDLVDAELRFFHGEIGTLKGRVDEISKRQT